MYNNNNNNILIIIIIIASVCDLLKQNAKYIATIVTTLTHTHTYPQPLRGSSRQLMAYLSLSVIMFCEEYCGNFIRNIQVSARIYRLSAVPKIQYNTLYKHVYLQM